MIKYYLFSPVQYKPFTIKPFSRAYLNFTTVKPVIIRYSVLTQTLEWSLGVLVFPVLLSTLAGHEALWSSLFVVYIFEVTTLSSNRVSREACRKWVNESRMKFFHFFKLCSSQERSTIEGDNTGKRCLCCSEGK